MVASTCVKTGVPILRRCRNGSIALSELSSNWFTGPAEVTGHPKLYSMTDSETALNTRPVVSRGSVSLLHGIEHPGQTDTFRSLSETEREPRNHRSRRCRNGSIALSELSSNWFTGPAEVTGHPKLYSMTDSETALNTRPVVSRGSVSLLHGIEHPGQTDTFRSLSETEREPRNHRSRRCRNGSIALSELSSNWFTGPAEVTGHPKLYSMTDSETALNTRPVVSRGSVSLLHGIEHPGQTDTFRSLSETEREPRNHRSRRCRNGSIALSELSSNWFTGPAEVTGHPKLYSMTDSETALNTRPVVSRGSVSLLHGIEHPGQTDTFRSLSETEREPRNHRSRCGKRLKAHV
ncbi:hypothetical protein DPMN_192682 [Dreissena polymorpha]|uniref:Uncharacterized protein n=1 Tax=Dreissena polymorpha TaxID=45954 RepID=A0A9D3Y3X3_DREPO|nr:hypothetical protein DPMN_192682 [Dreissena polymorpha]